MKKLISTMLSLVLLLSLIPSTFAAPWRIADTLSDTVSAEENPTELVQAFEDYPIESPPEVSQEVALRGKPDLIIPGPKALTVSDSVYAQQSSVTDSVYARPQMMQLMSSRPADPSILTAIDNMNIKNAQAPFTIDAQQESISTLNGNLTVQADDLSLPGRNGVSFSLKRIYDASASEYYEKGYEDTAFCLCRITYEGTYYKEILNVNTSEKSRSYYPYTQFYMDQYSHPQFMTNNVDAMGMLQYIDLMAGKGQAFGSAWSSADANGLMYREVWEVNAFSNKTFVDSFVLSPILTWRDKAKEKTYEEKLYPIGKGWMWNIPYVKYIEGKAYLNMPESGSYEIAGTTLKDYPFQDLTLRYESSVTVNGKSSYLVLKTLEGKSYYFANDGRLIQLSDAYGNAITFQYSQDAVYGLVLTRITDAIGNAIVITYNASSVVLTQGDKTVTYNKSKRTEWNTLPPFQQLETEILSSVRNEIGQTTSYSYNTVDLPFSLVGTTTKITNKAALLSAIYHPTGAATYYTYDSSAINRLTGPQSFQGAYRIASRKDVAAGSTYNQRNFSYTSPEGVGTDYGISYGQTIPNLYVNVFDGLTTTVYDHRKKVTSNYESPQFYTNKVTVSAGDESRTTTYVYDEARKMPFPIQTMTQFSKGSEVSSPVKTSATYDNYGHVLTETNPLGVVTTYTYDPSSHLLSTIHQPVQSNLARFTMLERNAQGSVTKMTVRQNNETGGILAQSEWQDFDSYGNVRRTVVKDTGRDIVYNTEYGTEYLGAFPTKQSIAVKNAADIIETISSQLAYQPHTGLVTAYTDGNLGTTRYEYDKVNRLTRIIHPDQSTATAVYTDGSANQVVITDETGVKTRKRWDRLGNLLDEAILDGSYRILKSYGYDTYRRPIWTKDNLNRTTSYAYDLWSRLIKTTHPDNSTDQTAYQELTRQMTTTDAEGNKWRSTSDVLGQTILQEEWRDGQFRQSGAATYNFEGQALRQTNASDSTYYTYDALGQLIKVKDALNKEYVYSYSLAGNITGVRYPDQAQTAKQYDELGRLLRQVNELGQADTYSYDANGNVISHTDRKDQVFTQEYNQRNWVTKRTTPDETITYTYDLAGRRKTMNDATGQTSYGYKSATGELTRVTYPDSRNISYTYNSLGLRDSMVGPFGHSSYYTYDVRNRLTGVGQSTTDQEATYTYYRNNLIKDTTLKNGNKSIMTYEGLKLKMLTHQKANGALLNQFQYGYDSNGNITNQSGTQSDILFNEIYSYDALSRVSTASPNNEAYQYDKRDNRQTMYSDNLSFFNDFKPVTYTYDTQNRLKSVQKDTATVAYRYNGDGLLYERSENGNTTRYYYDGDQVIAEGLVGSTGTVTMKASYTRGNQLAAKQDSSGKAYYLYNGHGDVIELRDSTGNTSLNRYTYDLWGKPLKTEESVSNPFRYSGELWDSTTELQYLRARWYDPGLGRFITKDTYEGSLDNPLSLNLYTYVHNNPLINIDPTGNYCVSKDGNWAHGGSCNSDTSIYMGDDEKFHNSPIIEKGIITGYIGRSGPFREKEFNFWKETTSGIVTGTADAILGNNFANQLLKNKPLYATMPALGPAAGVSGVKFPSATSKLLAGVSKMAGPVTVVLTGVEVYNDFQKYNGKDRWYASAMTVAGTAGTILIVAGISTAGAPVVIVIGAGAAIGAGVNYGVNWLKDQWFN